MPVLASYAVSLLLLAGLIGLSWRSWRQVKRALEKVEQDG
jgi:heme exporter protein CcmD